MTTCGNPECSSFGAVLVVDTANDTVKDVVPVGAFPLGLTVSPDRSEVYVANNCGVGLINCASRGTVSIIETATDTVSATVPVDFRPRNVAVTSSCNRAFIVNRCGGNLDTCARGTVSVINIPKRAVTDTILVGVEPVSYGPFIGSAHHRESSADVCENVRD